MATALIKRRPPAVEPISSVTLEMSAEEAEAVLAVLRAIGGKPAVTRRGLTHAVSLALQSAGVPFGDFGSRDLTGTLTFLEASDGDA